MFRSRNNLSARAQPIPVPATAQYHPVKDPTSPVKHSRNPLKKLKQAFSSKKDVAKDRENGLSQRGRAASSPQPKKTAQRKLSKGSLQERMIPQADAPLMPRHVEIGSAAQIFQFQRPKPSSKEASSGNSFMRRTLAKNKSERTDSRDIADAEEEREERDYLLLGSESEPQTGGKAGYTPPDATSTFCSNTKHVQPEHQLQRPSIAAYVPTHAASDFYRITSRNDPPAFDGRIGLPQLPVLAKPLPDEPVSDHIGTITTPLDDNSTPPLELIQPPDNTTDFQTFLLESKIVAARNCMANSNTMVSDRASESRQYKRSSRIMDDIMSTHQKNLCKAPSIDQRTMMSRTSKRGSILEKVHDYIKPPRAPSVYSSYSVNENSHPASRGSYYANMRWDDGASHMDTEEDRGRGGSRWSRVGGSIRRSFSRDRDEEGDVAKERARAVRTAKRKKKGESSMPPSGALTRYNQQIEIGRFGQCLNGS